jgi:hypothetical protein
MALKLGVSCFAQIPEGQRRKKLIRHPKAFMQTEPKPIRVSTASLRSMSGERKYPASAFNLSRRIAEASAGAAVGAVATIFVGFYWGGWSLASTADKIATEQSKLAVVAALAPVCADKFRAQPDAAVKIIALSKAYPWNRAKDFPKELVTLPGETNPSSALVDACYALLLAPKSAALN